MSEREVIPRLDHAVHRLSVSWRGWCIPASLLWQAQLIQCVMIDESNANDDADQDGLKGAKKRSTRKWGAGMGPATNMDKAGPVEEEDKENPPAEDNSGSNKEPDE